MPGSVEPKSGLIDLGAVFQTALDAVIAMRADGRVAEWNHVAEQIFGWTREQALGQFLGDLIVPQRYRAAHVEGIRRYNQTGEAVVLGQRLEISAVDNAGREFPVELSITTTMVGGERLFIGFLRDISARKRSEQLLIRRTREAELLFNISRLAGESETVEPVLRETLRAICELTGWPVGHALLPAENGHVELVSSGIWHGPDDASFERLRKATEGVRFTPGVGLPGVILDSGEPQWMSHTENEAAFVRKGLGYGAAFGFPLKSSSDIFAVLEFFTREVMPPDAELLLTLRILGEQVARVFERRRAIAELSRLNRSLEQRVVERSHELQLAHEALRQAQKLEAIGQLTGGIAHDFNNLLTVIRGSADLLRRLDLPPEKKRRYIDAISDTADRAARLTGQLLAFARRQALKPEVFDVGARIRSIADMLRTIVGAGTQLIIDDPCETCFVEADAGQFEASIVNLVVNARDAIDGTGKLTIAVTTRVEKDVEIVDVAVSDTGHGIPANRLDQIFEPFYTTKEIGRGTGLGLSQVYGFMKQSGGDVTVTSQEGVGTTFHLVFRRADAMPGSEEEREAQAAFVPHGSRVLVVEDNADIGEFAAQLLNDLGFQSVLVSNAMDGLDQIERAPDAIDLVFSDVVMPGMNGVEFARVVQDRWPAIPVVLTSGYSHVLAEESNHGFPLLHKPYSVDSLTRFIRNALVVN